MTWLRIDDDTYIDNTLVTCAEYQLFIDEMREQGKYYQPDHWNSNRFPKGRARMPILGMRPLDTEVFCEWLTKREPSEWRFRIPSEDEGINHKLVMPFQEFLGYWSTGSSNQFHLIPCGKKSDNPRDINPENIYILNSIAVQNVNRVNLLVRELDLDRDITLISSFVNIVCKRLSSDLGRIKDLSEAQSIFRDIHRAQRASGELVTELENNQIFGKEYTKLYYATREIDEGLAYQTNKYRSDTTFNYIVDQSKSLNYFIDAVNDLSIIGSRTFLHHTTGSLIRDNACENALKSCLQITFLLEHILRDLDDILIIYIDLFTLQERIAGRSPAFEGIRLVKERIR